MNELDRLRYELDQMTYERDMFRHAFLLAAGIEHIPDDRAAQPERPTP